MGFPARLRFGVFEVDLESGELRKQGLKLKLQDQPFQILAALLERQGEIVTREDLRQRLGASDAFGDFDHLVNKAVNKIREVLGDSADSPLFVETLPRRGYRWRSQRVSHCPDGGRTGLAVSCKPLFGACEGSEEPHAQTTDMDHDVVPKSLASDNAEDFKLGGRGHTTPHKRQRLRPRPVSLKVSWAKPGFGGTIALCVLNGTDLLCVGYGVETCSDSLRSCYRPGITVAIVPTNPRRTTLRTYREAV